MKTMIAVPCMDMVHTMFMTSLMGMQRVGEVHYNFKLNSLIYDSRNQIAADAMDAGADRILWLDSDVTFEPDLMKRLSEDMDAGREFVTGLYFGRRSRPTPVIYRRVDPPAKDPASGLMKSTVTPDHDFAQKEPVFRVDGCGFGACMMSVDIIRQVWEKFGPPFTPYPWAGEDISFCYRLKLLEIPVWCDRTVQVGHLGVSVFNEETYRQQLARAGGEKA